MVRANRRHFFVLELLPATLWTSLGLGEQSSPILFHSKGKKLNEGNACFNSGMLLDKT